MLTGLMSSGSVCCQLHIAISTNFNIFGGSCAHPYLLISPNLARDSIPTVYAYTLNFTLINLLYDLPVRFGSTRRFGVCVHIGRNCNMLCRCKMTPAIAICCTGLSPCCVCFVTFLHMNFSSTPNSILNLTISQEREFDTEFNDVICVGKYCQLVTHESIIDQYAISA